MHLQVVNLVKNSNTKQEIKIYYGVINVIINEIFYGRWEGADFNQTIKFSLYRNVVKYNDYLNYEKRTEIFTFNNTLKYFLSEEFLFDKMFYTDEITKEELIVDNEERQIVYQYELKPLEEEYIKLSTIATHDYTKYNQITNEYDDIKEGDIVGPYSTHSLFESLCSLKCSVFYTVTDEKIRFSTKKMR